VRFGAQVDDPHSVLKVLESQLSFQFPEELSEVLLKFAGTIMFDAGARFPVEEKSGLEDSDGFRTLLALYGLADNEDGLGRRNISRMEYVGLNLVAIGECPSGDQVCIRRDDGSVVIWHHEAVSPEESIFRVASDPGVFLSSLVPEQSGTRSAGIVESQTYMNF
jgi:hypothetical protein